VIGLSRERGEDACDRGKDAPDFTAIFSPDEQSSGERQQRINAFSRLGCQRHRLTVVCDWLLVDAGRVRRATFRLLVGAKDCSEICLNIAICKLPSLSLV
jgi:hypothetical protein